MGKKGDVNVGLSEELREGLRGCLDQVSVQGELGVKGLEIS